MKMMISYFWDLGDFEIKRKKKKKWCLGFFSFLSPLKPYELERDQRERYVVCVWYFIYFPWQLKQVGEIIEKST